MLELEFLREIPEAVAWVKVEPVDKGWSQDKKYYVETRKGERLLLRLAPIQQADKKRAEYEAMFQVAKLGIRMSQPLAFGICDVSMLSYTLLSWVDGETVEDIIATFLAEGQFSLGVMAGKMLQKIHTISAPPSIEPWGMRMRRKIDRHLARYREAGIKIKGDEHALRYIEKNIHLLSARPQVFQHGDYHISNLILTPQGELGVIDFNRWDYGDPWEEFYKMAFFSREKSISFANGQIVGYFGGEPPELFHRLMALYLADVILFSVVWAMSFGETEVQSMIDRARMILDDYKNFTYHIPHWITQDCNENHPVKS